MQITLEIKCPTCLSDSIKKNGIKVDGKQNYQCKDCKRQFIGDIVHSHTVQFDKPETTIDYDIEPKKAVQTRLKQFAEYAKGGQTIAAPHLPFPAIGHIYSADGKSYQWIPVHFKD